MYAVFDILLCRVTTLGKWAFSLAHSQQHLKDVYIAAISGALQLLDLSLTYREYELMRVQMNLDLSLAGYM